jgi:hypothetical protein
LKTKDEVFNKFQEFKALIGNQTCRKIKALRLDNGREYTSNGLDSFHEKARIKREFTMPLQHAKEWGRKKEERVRDRDY